MRLVLVHGRQQQGKDPDGEKDAWLDAMAAGMHRIGLSLPIEAEDVRFVYYGDVMDHSERGLPELEMIIRGDADPDPDELAFSVSVLREMTERLGVHDPVIGDGLELRERGLLQSPILRQLLQLVNDKAPGVGVELLRRHTHDVYSYITNQRLRGRIDDGVVGALSESEPNVVVGHSLGSVVAHGALRTLPAGSGSAVPLFVTLGCPLGVRAIQDGLRARVFPPVVQRWFNAFDPRDVVALAPLADGDFPPGGVENHSTVDNGSDDHHGIEGYLGDAAVARTLHAALTSTAPGSRTR